MALDKFQPYLFVSAGEQSNKFLTPVISPTGIASFQAQRAQSLTGLTVRITPVQDLHGQANPYPAGGGKNLLPPFSGYSGNGLTTTANSDGSITITGTATGSGGYLTDFINIAKTVASGTTVAFSTKNNVPAKMRVFYDDGTADIAANGNEIVFPCHSDVTKLRLYLFTTAGTTYNFTVYPQLEVGSTATDWSPYSNICPISGRTGLTVTRTGKNLGELVEGTKVSSQYSTVTYTEGGVSVVSTESFGRSGYVIPVVKGQHYTVSFKCKRVGNSYSIQFNNAASFSYASAYKLYASTDMPTDSFSKKSFSFVANTDVFFVGVYPNGVGNVIYIEEFQIETGDTATPYTPYVAPTTYPITWETEAGEVYGGTLDVVSGVLTVTDAQIASYAGETLPGEWISDRDVYAAGTTPTTGAQVVYKLATPQTYRLTGAEVRTIAGFNQIYSDAGPVIDIKF